MAIEINKDLIVTDSSTYNMSLGDMANWIKNEDDKWFLGTSRNSTYLIAKFQQSYSGPSQTPRLTLYGNTAGSYQRTAPFILTTYGGLGGDDSPPYLGFTVLTNIDVGNGKTFKLYRGTEIVSGESVKYYYLILESPQYNDKSSLKVLDINRVTLIGDDITSTYNTWKSDKTLINTVTLGAVTEEGTGDNGSYIKFGNGTLICWNKITMTNDVPITSQGGSLYYSSTIQPFPNYPVSFITPPVVFVTREGGGDNANYWISKTYDCGITNVRYFQLVASSSITASKPDLMYIAIGRWK